MSVLERTVQLHDQETGERASAPLEEVETLRLAPRGAEGSGRPRRVHVGPSGRRFGVERIGAEGEQLVFLDGERRVAELRATDAPAVGGDAVAWRLEFPDHPGRVLVAPLTQPPIRSALSLIELALAADARA